MKLSIIIPIFNEDKTIAQILEKVDKVKLPAFFEKEIIVINDGSYDNTNKILSKQTIKFKYFKHKKNLGKGAAIRTGLSKMSGDLIIIQDADLEYNPDYYSSLIEPILKNKALVVYGTRLTNYPLNLWGKNKTVLPSHLIANKLLTFLTNILFNAQLTDMETGYKVFRKKTLDNIKINSNNFDFEAEITAKILKKGYRIIEVPIITNPRTYKEGKKIGWRDGLSAIWTLIKYRFVD